MLKFGTNNIGKVLFGSNVIGKAYYGSNLVYSAGASPTPPGPTPGGDYSNFVSGKQINADTGELTDNTNYCVSPFIAIPSGTIYLTFNILDTSLSNPKIALYDSGKNSLGVWNQNTVYRTISLADYPTVAFVRFSELIETRGQEFLRVRDGSFNQSNIFEGPDYHTDYDKVIFGCTRGTNNNPPTENLTKAITELLYIDPSTTSVQFGAKNAASGNLLLFDESKVYSNYWGQNANPRTVTDNSWATTWRYVCRDFAVGQTDYIFIKNVTTDTYLFKGKNVE